jgi:hypothetical protein
MLDAIVVLATVVSAVAAGQIFTAPLSGTLKETMVPPFALLDIPARSHQPYACGADRHLDAIP